MISLMAMADHSAVDYLKLSRDSIHLMQDLANGPTFELNKILCKRLAWDLIDTEHFLHVRSEKLCNLRNVHDTRRVALQQLYLVVKQAEVLMQKCCRSWDSTWPERAITMLGIKEEILDIFLHLRWWESILDNILINSTNNASCSHRSDVELELIKRANQDFEKMLDTLTCNGNELEDAALKDRECLLHKVVGLRKSKELYGYYIHELNNSNHRAYLLSIAVQSLLTDENVPVDDRSKERLNCYEYVDVAGNGGFGQVLRVQWQGFDCVLKIFDKPNDQDYVDPRLNIPMTHVMSEDPETANTMRRWSLLTTWGPSEKCNNPSSLADLGTFPGGKSARVTGHRQLGNITYVTQGMVSGPGSELTWSQQGKWAQGKQGVNVPKSRPSICVPNPLETGHVRSEAKNLKSLHHPHIVKLFHYWEEESRSFGGPTRCYIVMERMSSDLAKFLKKRILASRLRTRLGSEGEADQKPVLPFSYPVAIDIMLQVAKAIGHMHSKNVIHRDLKPGNVLVRPVSETEVPELFAQGYVHVKLGDFGLARDNMMTSNQNELTENAGSSLYRAPELSLKEYVCGTNYPHKADVWSFGIMCSEILSGLLPFQGENVRMCELKVKLKSDLRPLIPEDCPDYLKFCIESCWKYDPEERPRFSDICRMLRFAKLRSLGLLQQNYDLFTFKDRRDVVVSLPTDTTYRTAPVESPNNLPQPRPEKVSLKMKLGSIFLKMGFRLQSS